MSHVFITRRQTGSGAPRYVVRYRWGGRAFPLRHLASKPTMREAKALRDWAAGEMIAGRDPRASLKDMASRASDRVREQTVDQAFEAFIGARLDTAEGTRRNYRKAQAALRALLGDREVGSLRVADVQAAVGGLADSLHATTTSKYVNTLRQVLDFAEAEPNVARDRRVKLPAIVREEPEPPDADHVEAMLERLTHRWRLAFVTGEQTGMRVGELASVTWGDVDLAGSRFRMRARETKSRRGKWVTLPAWLADEIAASCPLEDRSADRKVFVRVDEAGLRMAMRRACQSAGIAVYSPHDLRHRRITIWHHAGVPMREIQERVGHSRASITLDVYSHVMPVREVPEEVLRALLRSPREVPVRSGRVRA